MIPKDKRVTTRTMHTIIDNPAKPDQKNSELPESYRRLLDLIFHSSDPLIHRVQHNDKVSS